MFCDATSGKCKDTEKIWGLINKNTNKLHRLTFSKSLASMIAEQYQEYEMCRFKFKIGKRLAKGEESSTGLYAIMSSQTDITLRISLIKESAELMCEDDSRYLAEAFAMID